MYNNDNCNKTWHKGPKTLEIHRVQSRKAYEPLAVKVFAVLNAPWMNGTRKSSQNIISDPIWCNVNRSLVRLRGNKDTLLLLLLLLLYYYYYYYTTILP